MNDRVNLSPSEQTRSGLVNAALRLFGAQGFEATSTRQIAGEANANIGSIAYHFGGKDGLRMAVADHIVATIQEVTGAVLGRVDQALAAGMDSRTAQQQLSAAIERMVSFLIARPEADDLAQFMLRELSHPSPALDRIYSGVMEPTHRRLCRIWEVATGEPADSERTKITIFTLIGQVMYFRIGREVVQRRMGWPEIGPDEAAAVTDVVKDNLDAILKNRKGGCP